METLRAMVLKCALMEVDSGSFEVSVVGNKVTISSPDYTANHIWDMIDMSGVFGAEAVGWMSADPDEETVTLRLDLIRLQKVGNRSLS